MLRYFSKHRENYLNFRTAFATVLGSLLTAACGGGGGSSNEPANGPANSALAAPAVLVVPAPTPIAVVTPVLPTAPAATSPVAIQPTLPSPPSPSDLIAISAANAKTLAAVALDATTNPLAAQASSSTIDLYQILATHIFLSSVTRTEPCVLGGNISISPQVANATLYLGDQLSTTFTKCQYTNTMQARATLDGLATLKISKYSFSNLFIGQTILTKLTGSVQTSSWELSGEQAVDFDTSDYFARRYSLSGKSLTVKRSIGDLYRNTLWTGYQQTFIVRGTNTDYSLRMTLQTDGVVAPGGGSFGLTTMEPVVRSSISGLMTTGVIVLAGAAGSRASISLNNDGSATIQIDANGDGIFEATLTASAIELTNLL